MRQQFVQGYRWLLPAGGGARTNDTGEYRIFGLAPGMYYVSATETQGLTLGPLNAAAEGPEARSGYAPTFFPGTADIASAQKVTVGLSQTVSNINIGLLATRLTTISGTAVDAQAHPLTAGFVTIVRRSTLVGFVGVGAGGPLRSDGTFTIPNVSPGNYLVRANTTRLSQETGMPPLPSEFSTATVTVNGEDVTDVRLAPVVPVAVSGRVLIDDPGAAQSLKPSAIRLVMQPLNNDNAGAGLGTPIGSAGAPPPTVQDDLTFELKIVPGQFALRVNITSTVPTTPSGWQLKAIWMNGLDVTDEGFDVSSQGVRGVEVQLTHHLQQVLGTVRDATGGPAKDYIVVVFTQDRTRWLAPFNRYMAIGRPGDDSRFKVTNLPPGRYYAIALDGADASQWLDPDFLESLSQQAATLSLGPGDTATLDLRLFTLQ